MPLYTRQLMRLFALLLLIVLALPATAASIIKIYPAPKGASLSTAFKVAAGGKLVPVYLAKVGAADPGRRFKAVDDMLHSDIYFDKAAFAYFDLQGTANVSITVNQAVRSVKILPSSAGVKASINGKSISFKVSKPQNLTIEINGETVKSLHLFVNGIDANIPSPKDPNVIFFGPGIHEVSNMTIGDNKTVYIAGGAIIKAVIDPKERYTTEPVGFRNYVPTFNLQGQHIKFRGHGIIDASACPTHARNMLLLRGNDITVEGVIMLNPAGWTTPCFSSGNIHYNNIKIISYRANTDGIDICNSKNVLVENCFIRTNDDVVVVKTLPQQGMAEHITVRNCVVWNQLANALSIGLELRENVNDVTFDNCDIIHDTGRAWCMAIMNTDASSVTNVTFSNIRLEEAHQFINLWIGKAAESHDKQPGRISQVTFRNITVKGARLPIDLAGAGSQNRVDNVRFSNIQVNGTALHNDQVHYNQFVSGIVVQP